MKKNVMCIIDTGSMRAVDRYKTHTIVRGNDSGEVSTG